MANEIKLVTYANSEVTPQNDAVLTNLEIASNGVIFGCNVTIKNASTLHINAGMGVVYGREFEIVDSDIPVSLSSSGTLLGQLYVHIDLANTSEPAQLLVDTGNSLTPLVDDPTINITTGSTDYQLATFTVDTSTLASLTETFSIVDKPSAIIGNTDISAIADGTVTGAIAQINTDLSVKYNSDDDWIYCKVNGVWQRLKKAYLQSTLIYDDGVMYYNLVQYKSNISGAATTFGEHSISIAITAYTSTPGYYHVGAITSEQIDLTNYLDLIGDNEYEILATGNFAYMTRPVPDNFYVLIQENYEEYLKYATIKLL